jgi:hypothetical protein
MADSSIRRFLAGNRPVDMISQPILIRFSYLNNKRKQGEYSTVVEGVGEYKYDDVNKKRPVNATKLRRKRENFRAERTNLHFTFYLKPLFHFLGYVASVLAWASEKINKERWRVSCVSQSYDETKER